MNFSFFFFFFFFFFFVFFFFFFFFFLFFFFFFFLFVFFFLPRPNTDGIRPTPNAHQRPPTSDTCTSSSSFRRPVTRLRVRRCVIAILRVQ